MAEPATCPHCGKPVPNTDLPGLCPECMLGAGVASQTGCDPGAGATRALPPAAPEEIAPLFPHLEILECLGRGGMGAVYKARQPKLDRYVALKILVRERESDPKFAERFTREARALARLNHANIVTVHDFGEAGGHYYLLMEYVSGVSLRQLLASGSLTPEQALAIVPAICDALQFAHEHGVVHRDIKPENILLDASGRVKIADFGIAKMLDVSAAEAAAAPADAPAFTPGLPGSARPALTEAGHIVGTPHYMAPEQIKTPTAVDHRADIYSLGVVFYEMLTGELPVGQFAPASRKAAVDARLDQVIARALEQAPERRYQKVSEVKTDVETIAGPSAARRQPAVPEPHSRRRLAVSAILFLLPPVFFGWFLLFGHPLLGLDLDADVQWWTGVFGLPASAGLGALMAYGMHLAAGWSMARPGRWSWQALAAVAALVISLPLGGGAAVMLQLINRDPRWHPGPGEFGIGMTAICGAALMAAAAVLLGIAAERRCRRSGACAGYQGALAATWFWPGLVISVFALSGAQQLLWGNADQHRLPAVTRTTNPAASTQDVPGWVRAGSHPRDYETGLDRRVRRNGKASAYVKSVAPQPAGFGTLMQTFQPDAYRGRRVRLAGYIRSQDVVRGAGFWMRVDGPGDQVLAFDNMQNRLIRGTTGWKRYEIVLDVPESSRAISIGLLLSGAGTVWMDDLEFGVVGNDVPATASALEDLLPVTPQLEFTE